MHDMKRDPVAMRHHPYGTAIEFTGDSGLLHWAEEALPPERRPSPFENPQVLESAARRYDLRRTPEGIVVRVGGAALGIMECADHAFDRLRSDIELWVATTAPGAVFVHAGVVGWNGGAILLPGESAAGKTTLVRSLVDAGARYLSDDYAVLDENGLVWPFPKPMSVREADGTRTRVVPPGDPDPWTEGPLPVALVVSTRFEEGTVFEPEDASRARSVLWLLENAPAGRSRPSQVMAVAERALRKSRAIAAPRGESEDAARALLSMADWR